MTIVTMLVMMQIINISIDAPDPGYGKEDLSVNDIESCVEFVVELCFKQQNAIEESDDQDESSCKPHTTIMLFSIDGRIDIAMQHRVPVSLDQADLREAIFKSIDPTIVSPPPKVV